jgi:hypothetical protein
VRVDRSTSVICRPPLRGITTRWGEMRLAGADAVRGHALGLTLEKIGILPLKDEGLARTATTSNHRYNGIKMAARLGDYERNPSGTAKSGPRCTATRMHVPQPKAVETVVTTACYFGSHPVQAIHTNLGNRREWSRTRRRGASRKWSKGYEKDSYGRQRAFIGDCRGSCIGPKFWLLHR